MRLIPCEGCGRHLYAAQTSCPFCGDIRAAPIGGLLPWVIVGLLGTVGCGPTVTGDDGAQMGSSGEGAIETDSTTMDPTTTPTPLTSSTSGSSDDASATTEGSDGFDDADDNPCGFYAGCAPDGGGTDYECDLVAQDCPSDEKCVPWANDGGDVWNATRCSPVANNPAQAGEPCQVEGSAASGVDDCTGGALCWDVDPETNAGECIPLCTGLGAVLECDEAQVCFEVGTVPVPVCLAECNPLSPACAEGDACVPLDDAFGCSPVSGGGDQGEPCESLNGCDPGNVCLDDSLLPECEGIGCCSSLCDLAAPTCPGALACSPWYDEGEAPEGFENLGVCAVP